MKALSISNSLLLYVLLAILSLIARAERFLIINNKDLDIHLTHIRLLVLAGTSIRNLSMSVIPFRLGELSIPLLLRLKNPTEHISKNIHPIWISIIYDLAALLIFSVFFGVAILCSEINEFSISGITIGYYTIVSALFAMIGTALLLLSLPMIPKKVSEKHQYHALKIKLPLIKLSIYEILQDIPQINFLRSIRILVLSLLLRTSKYISLAFLFYSLNNSVIPNFTTTLFVVASFVSAELFSSLPGSGVMGFGGYELIFSICMGFFKPELKDAINIVTVIHILGFAVEIILGILIIPLSLFLSKSYNFNNAG